MKIILARHAESEGNVKGIMMSGGSWGLTERGKAQASALAEALKPYEPDRVYYSPTWRAEETAFLLCTHLGLSSIAFPGLEEMRQGDFEGMPAADLAKRWPELAAQWWHSPETMRPPGGETLEELQKRVVEALADVRQADPRCAIIVTHRYVLRALCCWVLQVPLSAFRMFDFPTAAYAVVEFEPTGREIVAYSATPHYAAEGLGWPLNG